MSVYEQIFEVIKNNPGCSVVYIASETDIDYDRVRRSIYKMEYHGYLVGECEPDPAVSNTRAESGFFALRAPDGPLLCPVRQF